MASDSETISDEGYSPDGNLFHYDIRSKGSVYTFRVGSRSLPLYPSVILCLGLLNVILLLTAIVTGIYCAKVNQESDANHYKTVQALLLEVKELKIVQGEAIAAKEDYEEALKKEHRNTEELEEQLKLNKTLSDSLQRKLEVLHVEKATLLSNTSDSSCGRCLPGWSLRNTSCYFYSASASLPSRNWADSRGDCISRGADLVVIDSFEEQTILFEYQPIFPPRSWTQGYWIGLTDHHAEGTWVWLNNVTVLDGGYWMANEPNNYGAGEDCGVFLRTFESNPRRSWFDGSCQEKKAWICEI